MANNMEFTKICLLEYTDDNAYDALWFYFDQLADYYTPTDEDVEAMLKALAKESKNWDRGDVLERGVLETWEREYLNHTYPLVHTDKPTTNQAVHKQVDKPATTEPINHGDKFVYENTLVMVVTNIAGRTVHLLAENRDYELDRQEIHNMLKTGQLVREKPN